MAESFGAGSAGGSSGVLSSTMRSIVRQSGDPHEREVRRVEDVVDLSPLAAQERRQADGPVDPPEASDSLKNPSHYRQTLERENAEEAADEAAREERDAERQVESVEAGPTGPINIGMAAAISIGAPDMVRRFDINGDERLDQRERGRAIESVQAESAYEKMRGGGSLFDPAAPEDAGQPEERTADGDAFFAEQEARKAQAAERRAEDEAKAERARAILEAEQADRAERAEDTQPPLPDERDAEYAAYAPQPNAGSAYARSGELGTPHAASRGVKA